MACLLSLGPVTLRSARYNFNHFLTLSHYCPLVSYARDLVSPLARAFRRDLTKFITLTLSFHVNIVMLLWLELILTSHTKQTQSKFHLNLHYDNMLFIKINVVYPALTSMGYKSLSL
uniref:Uncharacterized protein n=1 Tax=Nelumbo nucifera TaxID=4432 RepID=A0A822ZMQ9_NELNU|nr:TPA_asm: hypothetical protein HUJ06_004417 [Nelumbo nucifera]